MRTTDLKDLMEVVAALREKLHPDLDPDFLEAVIRAEQENPENDPDALREIRAALKAILAKSGTA